MHRKTISVAVFSFFFMLTKRNQKIALAQSHYSCCCFSRCRELARYLFRFGHPFSIFGPIDHPFTGKSFRSGMRIKYPTPRAVFRD